MMGVLFGKRDTALEETQRNQAAAADPLASAWVSANAGTGKTHVLTMRVLRLLLNGTAPERILALTYTKAAAAEMSKRVFERLADWVTASDDALKPKLAELLGRAATGEEMQRARRLFAIAIETPGGLKVQTIHAFCERLLQRFPLEAGVPAGFEILDDPQQHALLREATDATLTEAMAGTNAPLADAMHTAVAFTNERNFDALLKEVLRHTGLIDAMLRLDPGKDIDDIDDLSAAEALYRRALGLEQGLQLEAVRDELAGVLSEAEIVRARGILAAGKPTDIDLSRWLDAAARAAGSRRIEALLRLFMTKDGKPRASLMTKEPAAQYPDVAARLTAAQGQFLALHDSWCRLQLLAAAMALMRIGGAVMQRYTAAKARRAALDFDDLVRRAASLLRSSEMVDWVLYKLDGGLDHVLVDEAQDTSPVQWQVIRALANEFFSGSGAREDIVRTMFAVGDEKQSIYSFQGAAPNMFAAAGQAFAAGAGHAGLTWRQVPLTLSFRATEPLLAAVDQIFADPTRTPGITSAAAAVQHIAHRKGHAGLIEIWPLERPDDVAAAEPWSPLAEISTQPTVARLATRIAGTIDGWLKNGEILQSENRPVRAGDILILVRKRVPFAAAMVSALKARGIAVAGADRLVLTDQIAVQDLMALGDVLMLPDDDLALAAVLKSPLFGFDDGDLLALAPGRPGTLWDALAARAGEDARMAQTLERLSEWRRRAGRLPPFEFYTSLIDGDGVRGRMLARLGAEAADPIDEFLNKALAYDHSAAPSLQGFLCWLREARPEVKRDMEQGRNEVRVMTVHGAKGLEAPIVFLPDTCSQVGGRNGGLLTMEDAPRPSGTPSPFLWPVKGTNKVAQVQGARAAAARADQEEHNRLLYVALTRARDRLYVAGFEGGRPPPQNCWYNVISEGLAGRLDKVDLLDGRTVLRQASRQTAKPDAEKARAQTATTQLPLPDWAQRPAPPEPMLTIPLAPSRLAPLRMEAEEEDAGTRGPRAAKVPREQPPLPPLALADDSRFLRGTLTHALLEHLPNWPRDAWPDAARRFLDNRGRALPEAAREAIAKETLAVLRDSAFAEVFGPGSRAEVAIAAEIPRSEGSGPPLRLAGKIDRLAVAGDSVLIVDYKTNRPPPADAAHVADAYLLQLAAYRLAVQRIFTATHVRAAILWTDGPQLMEIPLESLELHQHRLWQLDPASLDA
jgi:ATP-dependent helicase/nuclease subunit A